MGFILDHFDKSTYFPVYQNRSFSTEATLKYVFLLSTDLEDLFSDHYVKIPHAVSAIFTNAEEQMRVDTHRSFDDDDLYIEEESLLSPPEAETDRFWRRKISRLTLLVSQFFLSLLMGKLCRGHADFIPENLANKHSTRETELMKKFFDISLSPEPSLRYQSFTDMTDALLGLEHRLALEIYHNMGSGIFTNSNLSRSGLDSMSNQATGPVAAAAGAFRPDKYELQIWSHLCQKPAQLILDIPAHLIVGRKVGSRDQMTTAPKVNVGNPTEQVNPEIEHQLQKKEDGNYYIVAIGGDQCLSRRHAEIHIPKNPEQSLTYQDLGSTHGMVVFQDASCQLTSSRFLLPGSKGDFPCPQDQYLKFGNTYVRIRPARL